MRVCKKQATQGKTKSRKTVKRCCAFLHSYLNFFSDYKYMIIEKMENSEKH